MFSDLNSNWEMKILLPSLLGVFLVVVIIFCVCLWRGLSVIQRTLCRCCHCQDLNKDPPREEAIVQATETSALIRKQADNRPVEHEYAGPIDKLKEPVQEEEGVVEGEYKSPEKKDRTVVA